MFTVQTPNSRCILNEDLILHGYYIKLKTNLRCSLYKLKTLYAHNFWLRGNLSGTPVSLVFFAKQEALKSSIYRIYSMLANNLNFKINPKEMYPTD